MKTVKKISLLILSLISIVAITSCSSGSSSSEGSGNGSGPLDLTGSWVGTVTFVQSAIRESGSGAEILNSGQFGAFATIVQDVPVTIAGTSAADITVQVTSPDGCVYILNVDGATVNGRTDSFSAVEDSSAFLGTATNSSLSGSFNLGTDGDLICGIVEGRAEFRRA